MIPDADKAKWNTHQFILQVHTPVSRGQAFKVVDNMINVAIKDAEDIQNGTIDVESQDAEVVCMSEFVLKR